MKIAILLTLTLLLGVAVVPAQEHIDRNDIGPGLYSQITVLHLSGEKTVEMSRGASRKFNVLSEVPGRAGSYRRVVAPTIWSISPATHGVTIDANGYLKISPSVAGKTAFTVKASVTTRESWEPAGYQSVVEQNVLVFDPSTQPLVGYWYQLRARPCRGAPDNYTDRDGGIGELRFRADGTFTVTEKPFEAYKDYWGTYTTAGRAIEFSVDNGNSIPIGSSSGTYRLTTEGTLEFDNISLWYQQYPSDICGMTFARYGTKPTPQPVAWLHYRMEKCCVDEYVWQILDDYFRILNIEVPSTGHIVIRPRTAAAGKRVEKLVRDRIKAVKFDPDRIVFHTEKFNGSSNTLETWLAPPGAVFEGSR